MTDLAAFLTARLDESQAIAQAALDAAIAGQEPPRTPGHWHTAGEDPGHPSSFELHFEPEAILADVAAKRAIIEDYQVVVANNAIEKAVGGDDVQVAARDLIIKTLRMVLLRLATPYADHPDYLEEWKP